MSLLTLKGGFKGLAILPEHALINLRFGELAALITTRCTEF